MSPDDARDDLAFIRGLVTPSERSLRTFGENYAAGGACYGAQMLMHAGQMFGLLPGQGPAATAIAFGPTVVFVALLSWILTRPAARRPVGGASRSVGVVFRAIGLANLVLMVVIGALALRMHNLTVWLIYPCVVLVMQGAGWMVAASLWRRTWMAVVAVGWLAVGLAAGLCIQNITAYAAIIGVGLFAFMLAPGLYMMRNPSVA